MWAGRNCTQGQSRASGGNEKAPYRELLRPARALSPNPRGERARHGWIGLRASGSSYLRRLPSVRQWHLCRVRPQLPLRVSVGFAPTSRASSRRELVSQRWRYYTVLMTIAQAVQVVAEALAEAGIAEARREAEVLVAAALRVERAYLIAHAEQTLATEQLQRVRGWARRRAAREPLPYITHRVWFYGLELCVGRGALIPRPETELLVERFLSWARQQTFKETPILIDAGTGTGAIAIACLTRAPQWLGVGIDRSHAALRIAAHNRRQLGLEPRLLLMQGDWLRGIRPHSAHAILANPPYVLPDEWDSLAPEIRHYEPRGALLVPAEDPLQPYRTIALAALQVLCPPGLLAVETSPRLAPTLAEALQRWGYPNPHLEQDYSGHLRVVWATIP